jgi:hypothetical protein
VKRGTRDRLEGFDHGPYPAVGRSSGASFPVPTRGAEATGEGLGPDEGDLLSSYLRLLGRYAEPDRMIVPATSQVRTCSSCGRRALVHLDPVGSWAWCSACGRAV